MLTSHAAERRRQGPPLAGPQDSETASRARAVRSFWVADAANAQLEITALKIGSALESVKFWHG